MAIEVMQDIHETQPSIIRPEGNSISAISFRDIRSEVARLEGPRAQALARTFFLENPDMQSATIRLFGPTSEFQASFDPTYKGTRAQQEQTGLLTKRLQESESWVGQKGRSTFKDQREVNRRRKALEWAQVSIGTQFGRVNVAGNAIMDEIPYEPDDVVRKEPSRLVTAARNLTLAAGIALSPITQVDSSYDRQRPAIVDVQSQGNEDYSQSLESASNENPPEVDLLNQLAANFNEAALIENSNGEFTQRVDFQGTAINVKLTKNDIAEINRIKQRINKTQEAATGEPFKIYIVITGKNMTDADRPVQTQPAKPPSATRTAERPPVTATPSATGIPVTPVTPTFEPSPTTLPTATETPETGPLKELALNIGDEIIVVDDSYKYALVGKNGDKESGAAAIGYDFEKMENPVRDGDYVVGTVMKDGKPLTIRTPLDLVDPAMRDRIQQGNPDEDSRLRSEVSIWKGSDEPGIDKPVRITANYNGSLGVYGRTFFGDFKKGALIELNGKASGNAKTGDMVIMSWNQDTKTAETLTFRCNTQGTQWTVLSSTQASSSFAALLESRKTSDGSTDGLQAEQELYRFAMGQTDIKVETKDGNLNILDKDGKVIQTIPLTNAMESGLVFVDFGRTGPPKSQALITVNRAHISFSHPLEGTPQLSPESRLPTLVDLAEANGIRIMAQANATYLSNQPGLLDLYKKTAHIIDTNSAYRDGADLQSFLIDQNRKPAIVLGADIPGVDLVNIIKNHPGSVFQFVARGTSNGPEGTVTRPDGTIVDKKKLQDLLDAAAASGSEVMLNTLIPPDKKLYKAAETDQTATLSPQTRLLEELKTLKNQSALTVLLAGDARYILDPNMSNAELVASVQYALRVVQESGLKAGLANISGPDTAYFSMMSEIASDLKDVTLGFGTSLNTETTPVGLFDYTIGPVADFQTVSYSEGEDALYNTLLKNLTAR